MPKNEVSAVLLKQAQDKIIAIIADIKSQLPFLINLTEADKARMPGFGDKSLAFAQKTLNLAQKQADFLPRSFSVEEMEKDVNLYEALYSIIQPMKLLMEKLTDTFRKVGVEAYEAARIVYSSARQAGRSTGGLDAIMADIGKRFARKSKNKGSETA